MKSHILIVEDERLLHKAMAITLRREGYEVEGAMSGADAWEILNLSSIDLLILDIGLPDYDGLDLLSEIRLIYPALQAIVMTAFDGPGIERRAIDLGATAFLTKPVALQLLKETVRIVQEKRDQERMGSQS
jgi:DNA-binding response OmpR family regulator